MISINMKIESKLSVFRSLQQHFMINRRLWSELQIFSSQDKKKTMTYVCHWKHVRDQFPLLYQQTIWSANAEKPNVVNVFYRIAS